MSVLALSVYDGTSRRMSTNDRLRVSTRPLVFRDL